MCNTACSKFFEDMMLAKRWPGFSKYKDDVYITKTNKGGAAYFKYLPMCDRMVSNFLEYDGNIIRYPLFNNEIRPFSITMAGTLVALSRTQLATYLRLSIASLDAYRDSETKGVVWARHTFMYTIRAFDLENNIWKGEDAKYPLKIMIRPKGE